MKPSYALWVLMFLLFSCEENKNNEKPNSPRVKKTTKVESPSSNETYTRGVAIPVNVSSNTTPIDSIQVTIDGVSTIYMETAFDISFSDQRVGSKRLIFKVFCGEVSETHSRKVIILPENAPEEMTYTVVNKYPHNKDDYTQGLLVHEGKLYESNGQRGKSTLKKKVIATGETEQVINLASDLFGEGLALHDNKLFQLTWTSGQALVYDLEFNQTTSYTYQMEGWGLATHNDQFILTDGTEKIYFIDPQSFTVNREQEVYDHDGKVSALNESEMIDGKLYANVYQEDFVVVIDPETGEVLQKIDFSGLLSDQEAAAADVLNGIAVDPENGKIYVTGKWWPWLFEITIQSKTI